MNPGSWWEKPLWSCRQTWLDSRYVNDDTGARQSRPRVTFSHLACWLNIESTMWVNAS